MCASSQRHANMHTYTYIIRYHIKRGIELPLKLEKQPKNTYCKVGTIPEGCLLRSTCSALLSSASISAAADDADKAAPLEETNAPAADIGGLRAHGVTHARPQTTTELASRPSPLFVVGAESSNSAFTFYTILVFSRAVYSTF